MQDVTPGPFIVQFKLHDFNIFLDSIILYHVRFYLSVNTADCASRVKSRFDTFSTSELMRKVLLNETL